MAKRFETEPETPGEDVIGESLLGKQLQQKVAQLESKIRDLESKISATLNDPAFKNRIDTDSESWRKNENALGNIAGTLKSENIGRLQLSQELRKRLEDDVT